MRPILAYGPQLQADLATFIKAKRARLDSASPWGADFLDRLQPFATAGKLLRGSLVCFSYETFSSQSPSSSVINAAMALELTHSALLIHDDIMDGDELRRGRPSFHRQYQTVGADHGLLDTPQFGINMAMCGGDIALFLAFGLLASSKIAPEVRATVDKLFTGQLVDTCVGQMQDVYFEARPAVPSKRAIYGIMRAKTATYTLALPLAMGAALAGQSVATLSKLQAFGAAAGTIFQIRDDELGVMGNSRKTGKPVGADIKEGKKTLLYYYLTKRCTATERKKMKTVFGNPNSTTDDVAYVQDLVQSHRIPQLLNDDIMRLETRATRQIDSLDLSQQSKAELQELVTFCAQRQS